MHGNHNNVIIINSITQLLSKSRLVR